MQNTIIEVSEDHQSGQPLTSSHYLCLVYPESAKASQILITVLLGAEYSVLQISLDYTVHMLDWQQPE